MFFSYFKKSTDTTTLSNAAGVNDIPMLEDYANDTTIVSNITNDEVSNMKDINPHEIVEAKKTTFKQKIFHAFKFLEPVLVFSAKILLKTLQIYIELRIKEALANKDAIVKYENPEPSAPLQESDNYIKYENPEPSAPPLKSSSKEKISEAKLIYDIDYSIPEATVVVGDSIDIAAA